VPLQIFDSLPEGLLGCPAAGLKQLINKPSLIHLKGDKEPPLFVVVLLHGNETSGWEGLVRYLNMQKRLKRSMSIFIGNVDAAEQNLRTMPNQQDFNRIWRNASGPEAVLVDLVLGAMGERSIFATVDLHNNTGRNPHYSVVTDFETSNLGLALLFSDKAVYVQEPDTVLTRVMAQLGPSVALELGPIGDIRCEERAYDYITRLMALESIPSARAEDLCLFRSQARIHIKDDVSFSFADDPKAEGSLILTAGMEAVNFHEIPAGTCFGQSACKLTDVFQVLDAKRQDVTDKFFTQQDNKILLKQSVVPSMYTTDSVVVRQDCLCYLMERIEHLNIDRRLSLQLLPHSKLLS